MARSMHRCSAVAPSIHKGLIPRLLVSGEIPRTRTCTCTRPHQTFVAAELPQPSSCKKRDQRAFQQLGAIQCPYPIDRIIQWLNVTMIWRTYASLPQCDCEWNCIGCSQIAYSVPNQAVPLSNPQSYSNPEPHSDLVHHWCAEYAASSDFEQSPDADLPPSAVDAQSQFAVDDHGFHTNNLCDLLRHSAP